MDERNFRARARAVLQDNWGLSIGAAALAYLLGGILTGSSFLPSLNAEVAEWLQISYERPAFIGNITSALSLAGFIIGGVVQLGYTKFLLSQHDGKPYELNDLFSQFDRFKDGFIQNFLRGLYIALWSLLFIIPGIIAGYSYAMTPFLMAENPDLTPSQAIAASKEMMYGHKGELFTLDLSFFGWMLLCTLTLNVGNLWLNPYRNAAYAAFYRELQAQYTAESADYYNYSAETVNR